MVRVTGTSCFCEVAEADRAREAAAVNPKNKANILCFKTHTSL